ncbi:DUF4149 domain-containing protein [Uliginosibacterium flavum]|uniref:DUF4149 domain-containing protein n=1 Tax=Uliginosibacterium flavum TaxID=1396831 RepID=A0ABV2TFJ6_9RHOO
MRQFAHYLYVVAITLWVGSLWAIGYISAPTLFLFVADRSLAGTVAGKQFAAVAYLGMACAAYLFAYLFFSEGARAFRLLVLWLIALMLLLVLAGHFGVAPIIEQLRGATAREMVEGVVRNRFQTWHGIASLLWLIQSVLGLALVTQVFRR